MNNMDPQYLTGIFQQLRDDVHGLTLWERPTYLNLRLQRISTNIRKRSFSYQGADVWNKIDLKNKIGTSLQSFRRFLFR